MEEVHRSGTVSRRVLTFALHTNPSERWCENNSICLGICYDTDPRGDQASD